MPTELWGTFSVRDHLAERAFIADVLLYDRLVIPTLPENADPHDWPQQWNLTRQQELLGVLGDLAIPIPWTKERRAQYQDRYDHVLAAERARARADAATEIAFDANIARSAGEKTLSYHVTRMLLADMANPESDDRLFKRIRATGKVRPGSTLETVTAYTGFDNFNRDIPIDLPAAPVAGPGIPPTAIFGWNFFIPASAERGVAADLKLLNIAAGLARRADFIAMRGELYQWLADVSAGEISLAEAREDMERRLAEYNKIMQRQEWMKLGRRVIKVADAFSGGLGLVNEIAGQAAEAFCGSADIVADERLQPPALVPRVKVAAMFHDAQQKFGWQPLRG